MTYGTNFAKDGLMFKGKSIVFTSYCHTMKATRMTIDSLKRVNLFGELQRHSSSVVC